MALSITLHYILILRNSCYALIHISLTDSKKWGVPVQLDPTVRESGGSGPQDHHNDRRHCLLYTARPNKEPNLSLVLSDVQRTCRLRSNDRSQVHRPMVVNINDYRSFDVLHMSGGKATLTLRPTRSASSWR